MEFRPTPTSRPVQIPFGAFCDMVRAGKVPPTALYREPWTLGEWRTVDNLRPFHRLSPVAHPPGPRLIEAEAADRESDQVRARLETYRTGTFVEDQFGLRPLADVAAGPGVVGAARLMVFTAFDVERVVTVAFDPAGVAVEAVAGRTPRWHSLSQVALRKAPDGTWESTPIVPFDAAGTTRIRGRVSYGRAPGLFASWGAFARTVSPLPPCATDTLDGASYRHKMTWGGQVPDVRWSNPDRAEHAAQVAVVRGYLDLLLAVRMAFLLEGGWRQLVGWYRRLYELG